MHQFTLISFLTTMIHEMIQGGFRPFDFFLLLRSSSDGKCQKKRRKLFFSALGQRKNFLPKIKYFFRFSFGFNLIFNVRKFSSIAIYADKLFGCPLENFLQSRACLFLYNLLRTREPHYLYANLNFPRRRRNESLSLPIILT